MAIDSLFDDERLEEDLMLVPILIVFTFRCYNQTIYSIFPLMLLDVLDLELLLYHESFFIVGAKSESFVSWLFNDRSEDPILVQSESQVQMCGQIE
jgi:hypothetical protein